MSELYLAERFWPAGGLAELEAASRRLRAAADRGGDTGEQVRYLGSVLVPSDEVVFCLFEAANVAAVRAVNERAEVALDRIIGCHGVVGAIPAPRSASVKGEQR